ncbi:MAG: hypothetical protein K2L70_06670 [Clostridia bacterium]|nr:hypothetical protein [Clostridia bacterium]
MDRLTKQIIKCKVMQYPHMRNKIADEIADVCEKGANTSSGVLGGYSSTRNTSGFDERLAKIMSKEDYLWCQAIESAVGYFNERGREEVVKAVEGLYWKCGLNANAIALRLHISRTQVYNSVDDFFDTVHKFGIKNGVAKEI